MFYSIRGKLIYSDPTFAVVECGGVGFKVFISLNTLRNLPSKNEEVTLYTHLNVKEDALDLYGFSSYDELEFFKILTTVSGVGAKVAIAILSDFTPKQIALTIASGDSKTLTKASGVGGKLAQRIVLELKDKVAGFENSDSISVSDFVSSTANNSNVAEATAALIGLGYTQTEAVSVLSKLNPELSVAELIKAALKAGGK
jgi:Holliday junction DNA helicase RuvA